MHFFKPNIDKLEKKKDVSRLIKILSWGKDNIDDRYFREKAVLALGRLGDPRAIEPLLNMDVSDSVEESLVKIGKIEIKPLLMALNNAQPIQELVASCLGKIGDSRAINHLIILIQKDEYTQSRITFIAADALVKLIKNTEVKLDDNKLKALYQQFSEYYGDRQKNPFWEFTH
jgi:HEAT repeat protein